MSKTSLDTVIRRSLAKSANYTITDTDPDVFLVTTGASNVTLTLPTVADNTGRQLLFVKLDSGAGTIILDGEGAETINGETTLMVCDDQYDAAEVHGSGSAWYVIRKHAIPVWYPWLYRRPITIDNTKVDAALTDFPVRIELDSLFDFTKCQTNGEDIRFDGGGLTKDWKYEIDQWDKTGQKATIWVKVPSVASGADTVFYFYYGNAAASDAQDAANVWDSHYRQVLHLDDDPDTSTVQDSTSGNVDGAKTAAGEPVEVAGQVGKAQSFDGANDIITVDGLVTALASDTIGAITALVRIDTTGHNAQENLFYLSRDVADGNITRLGITLDMRDAEDKLYANAYKDSNIQWDAHTGIDSLESYDGQYLTVTITHDGTNATIYLNGTAATNWTDQTDKTVWFKDVIDAGEVTNPADSANIGVNEQNGGDFGLLSDKVCEFFVSGGTVAAAGRSAAWAKAMYNNFNDSLASLGSEES